ACATATSSPSPAASAPACCWPACWRASRTGFWPTNPWRASTPPTSSTSSTCCATSPRKGRASSSHCKTSRWSDDSPTASSPCATEPSWQTAPPAPCSLPTSWPPPTASPSISSPPRTANRSSCPHGGCKFRRSLVFKVRKGGLVPLPWAEAHKLKLQGGLYPPPCDPPFVFRDAPGVKGGVSFGLRVVFRSQHGQTLSQNHP